MTAATKGNDSMKTNHTASEVTIWDNPHSDESGASRRIVIATCLAGKDSGEVVMHMTPREERQYNDGMARMAECYPD